MYMAETGGFDQLGSQRYRSYLRLLADLQFPAQLRRKVDPSDIVQETFVRACANAAQFRGNTEAEQIAWLRTILTNVLLDETKKYGASKRNLQLDRSLQSSVDGSAAQLEGMVAAQVASPSEHAVRIEQVLRLADAMEQLTDGERQAVQMHHLQGKPLAEIATALGRTKPAVASLLYRSMNKLRKSLAL
jgi:RNA polymerase sigma-70 factor (ECF subfamily)